MADPKATLTFKLDTPPNQRWSGALPIEVRDEKLVLRARGVSDDTLEVPPGRYYVTALLPNGDQSTVDGVGRRMPARTNNSRHRVSDIAFPPPSKPQTRFRTHCGRFPARSHSISSGSRLRSFAATGWPTNFPTPARRSPVKREPTTRSNLDIPFSREAVWIEIERSKQYNYFAVPVDEGGSTTVEWSLDIETDKLTLELDFA